MTSAPLRILVTGVAGQVGSALSERAQAAGMTVLPMRRSELDLTRPETIAAILDHASPDIVVNCAAYTAVDQAESEPALAFTVNADSPGAMARWCGANNRALIQLSTDYVFPGTGTRPYREDDPIGPVSAYGTGKAEGESRVRQACARHVILRTAWVYAAEGKNFVRTMLRVGAERELISVVDDQRGCPTAAENIADVVCRIAPRLAADEGTECAGTYHYVDAGETTWHGMAERIFAKAETRWGRRPELRAITTAQYPTPARRPGYSVLDTTKIRSTFAIVPPSWQDSLDRVLAHIFSRASDGIPY